MDSKSYSNPMFIVGKNIPLSPIFISLKTNKPFFLIFAVFDTLNTACAVLASPWKKKTKKQKKKSHFHVFDICGLSESTSRWTRFEGQFEGQVLDFWWWILLWNILKNNDFSWIFLFLSCRNAVFCDFPFCTKFLWLFRVFCIVENLPLYSMGNHLLSF